MSSREPFARVLAAFDRWNGRLSPAGSLTLAALAVAFATGVALAPGYDVNAASDSLALLQLSSRAGRLLRAAHAWSSHLALVLCALHAIEHVLRRSELRLRAAVWLRVVLLAPLLAGVALTGFMLRGDAEGRLARQIVTGLLELPARVGPALATALLGSGDDLQLVYLLHAATLPVVLVILSIEHGRRLWPGAGGVLAVSLLAGVLGWVLPPSLQAGAAPVEKGPWYFLAVQELLHWLRRPAWVWLAFVLPLGLLFLLRWLQPAWRARAVRLLAVLLGLYALAGLGVQLFRGPGWAPTLPWKAPRLASQTATAVLSPLPLATVPEEKTHLVQGRREGCLACHGNVQGIEPAHDPRALGCSSCHLGDPSAPDAAGAHRGMVMVPGNLDGAERTCGQPSCHGAIVSRVRGSLMATVRGMIAVDRFAFGESPTPDGDATPSQLGDSPADSHLRQLCVVCHLGTAKSAPAPVGEGSRGGGCVACHLRDDRPRTSAKDHPADFVHPALSVRVRDEACFGCHSRSGRISLSYAGWAEAEPSTLAPGERRRVLEDGRTLRAVPADVHHEKGMACIDCHTAQELMGDGRAHLHEEQATRVRCETCHRVRPAREAAIAQVDADTQAIVRLRDGADARPRLLLEDRTGEPLSSSTPLADGTVETRGKLDGRPRLGRPPARACTAIAGHARLSCQSCHSPRAPRCVGCHTQNDRGTWLEYDVAPLEAAPSLGLLRRDGRAQVEPVVPGMVLTLNREPWLGPGPLPDDARRLVGPGTRFLRAYAYAAPHSTTRAGRSCRSCHLDPLALGLGQGALAAPEGEGDWAFAPAFEPSRFDGLPADAWFGAEPARAVSTRTQLSPLDAEGLRRTLEPGACMACHDPDRNPQFYERWDDARRRLTPRCRARGAVDLGR